MRITYDIGHANLTQEGPIEFCKGIVHLIINVHVSDNNGTRDQHRPLGLGNIDFYEVFKVLAKNHYNGAIVIERPYDTHFLNDIKMVNNLLTKLGVKLT